MGKLLDIFNPIFNLKEVCKEFVLLEDHLVAPGKHCPDCIRKHLLRAEAFAEEAIALDKEGEYKDLLANLPQQIRDVGDEYMSGNVDKHMVGQKVRFIRKALSPMCFPKGKGGKNSPQMNAKPVKNDASSPSWDFWSGVGSAIGIPPEQIIIFSKSLQRSVDSNLEPYFAFDAPGVSYRVRNSTDWVQKQLIQKLSGSTVSRMIQVSKTKGKQYSIKDWEMGIKSALGKSKSEVKFEAPSSSLGEFIDNRNVAKRSYEKAIELGLNTMIQKARRAERNPDASYQFLAAKYYDKIGDVSKIDFFWAKAAGMYSDHDKAKEESKSLSKIITHYPDHDLKFWIVNRIAIFDKQSDQAMSPLGSANKATENLKIIIPVLFGLGIGLL